VLKEMQVVEDLVEADFVAIFSCPTRAGSVRAFRREVGNIVFLARTRIVTSGV
jgi:hypothetical protein